MHVSNQLGQTKLPFRIRVLLQIRNADYKRYFNSLNVLNLVLCRFTYCLRLIEDLCFHNKEMLLICDAKSSYLNPLIGVAHHSNEQVDEDNDGDQDVNGETDLEQLQGPIPNVVVHLEVLGSRQTKQGEEQALKHMQRSYIC